MAFEVKYRAEFSTTKGNNVRIDILEDAVIASITSITVGVVSFSRPDGRLDKFTGVRQSEIDFEVFIDDNINPDDFLTTSDTQYRVILYVNDEINFVGWLDTNGYKYQLADSNYLINLNAKDGLHLLENEKFEPGDDLEFFGQYTLTQFIYSCLKKTSLINGPTDYTPYNTWINIYPDGFPVRGAGGDTLGENDPLNNIYIDAGTFRTGVNEYDNPYVVLNKICESFKATLFQQGGEWHFVYVEDWIRNNGLTGTKWDHNNDAISYSSDAFEDIEVGLTKPYKLANNNANVSFTSPYSKARLDISYDVPVAKIQNQDFSKVDESTLVTDSTNGYQRYDMRDWSVTGSGCNIMQRLFADDNPLANGERWAQFRDIVNGQNTVTLSSQNIFVAFGDMFNIKFELGTATDSERFRFGVLFVVTVTDGVTTYYMRTDGTWSTNSNTVAGIPYLNNEPVLYNFARPKTAEYYNVAPIPLDGNMQVKFQVIHNQSGTATNNYTAFIQRIEFEYKSVLGYNGRTDQVGRRRPLAGGQYYESSEDVKTKNIYQGDIYLFNSPQETISGSILDSSNELVNLWYHAGITEEIPFGRLITDAVWKSVYRNFINLEGNLLNVISGNQIISHLNRLKFDELPNKVFMITTVDVDIRNEQAEISCVELLDESNTDDFDELATTRKTGYISDVGGKLFNKFDPYNLRKPSDYAFGVLGYLLDGIFKSKRRR